ncbi:MAG TPA: branched-chain amino acid aminotransferase [Gemmatimonadales bacterium]|nr:branched-chain amino acid aminotransferase [Gemmatimonadales bacterium]
MTLTIDFRRTATPAVRPAESELGFGRFFTDHMFRMDWARDRGWHDPRIEPVGALGLEPAAAVLHYAQTIFDGLKVFRAVDGSVRGFRLDDHCRRINASAERLCMPAVDVELLRDSIVELVRVEQDWVPSAPGTALYVRPTMVGSEAFLGVRPAERYIYFVILSPVGNYYGATREPVRIWVEMHHVRAAPGGLGAAKTGANYAASLYAAAAAKQRGFDQVLWLDAIERRYVEEVGTMNLFARIGDEVITPPLDGTILAGMTRDSSLRLLRDWGLRVSERRLSIDEIRRAHARGDLAEVFGTGTAAVVSPVGELGFPDGSLMVGDGTPGEVGERLYRALTDIHYGRARDPYGWLMPIA